MNFLSMDYFITVAQEKSFTKAAEHLHITQQTLSAHIANVEKELGCQLFLRNVPLKLTYAGEVFLRYATDFQQKYSLMQKEFQDITTNTKGKLRIGIGYTRGRTIMPLLIDEFQKDYPMLQIELIEDSNEMLQKYLLEREIDLAIASFPDSIPGIELYPFYNEEVALLISNSLLEKLYKENLDEVIEELNKGNLSVLHECPFVLGTPDGVTGRISRYFIRQAKFNPIVKAQSDNMETLLALCRRGVGACFCPRNLKRMTLSGKQISDLTVFPLSDEAKYQIRFGILKQSYQWKVVQEFMNTAIRLLKTKNFPET